MLDPVEVRSRRDTQRERTRFETEAGVTTRVITGDEIKILPGLGEADVLRAVEVLPGVVSTSDFSSAFNVRGGSSDQNLILLDGFTIFNPFHLGGLFSVFNSDVIARAELLSGGFGAEYGGRVSSVLTVESDAGEAALSARTWASPCSPAALALHSRAARPPRSRGLGGQRGSWFLSGRRSYFDALLRPVTDFPYHLTDLQAGATLETARRRAAAAHGLPGRGRAGPDRLRPAGRGGRGERAARAVELGERRGRPALDAAAGRAVGRRDAAGLQSRYAEARALSRLRRHALRQQRVPRRRCARTLPAR